MRIMITGGTGLIGNYLAQELGNDQHEIMVLTRDSQRTRIPGGANGIRWDGRTSRGWYDLINKDTVIINLAGEPLRTFRWTERHKARVLGTRIETARAVLKGIHEAPEKPRLLIQPSYVGFFGNRGDEILNDKSAPGEGYRADACKIWERASNGVEVRRVILRMGHVLSPRGGLLPGMRFAALLGGKRFGTGEQYMSWVHIEDVLNTIRHVLNTDTMSGTYNVTSPSPSTNQEFMDALHRVSHFPKLINVPDWMINAVLGVDQASVVMDSQRVIPERLMAEGFRFKYDDVEWALRQLLRGGGR